MATYLVCRLDGGSFEVFRFISIVENITCTCQTSYCDGDTALIEQQLAENAWQKVSTMKKYYDGQFEITAMRTQFNSSTYRCIIPYVNIPTVRSNSESSLDRFMIAGCFIMLAVLVLHHLISIIVHLLKHQNQAVAVIM